MDTESERSGLSRIDRSLEALISRSNSRVKLILSGFKGVLDGISGRRSR